MSFLQSVVSITVALNMINDNYSSDEYFCLPWCNSPSGLRPPHYRGFMITLRQTTLRRTPLDEWSAQRRDLYLTTHNTHNHPCPPQDLNPLSQHLNGRRPTP